MAINLEALRAKHAEITTGGSSGDWTENYVQLKEGENIVRILPPSEASEDAGKQFYAETAVHRIPKDVTADGKHRNFHCRKIHGEACPVCDAYYSLWESHNKLNLPKGEESEFSRTARMIKPGKRYYMNVIDRGSENKVKILSVGIKVFTKVIDTMLDQDYGDITSIEEGHDFKVVKKQIPRQDWPAYDQSASRPKPSKAMNSAKEISEAMDSLHDIYALAKVESYEDAKELAELFVPSEVPEKEIPDGSSSDEEFMEKLET